MKIQIATALILISGLSLAQTEKKVEPPAPNWTADLSAGYFYDTNVAESVVMLGGGLPPGQQQGGNRPIPPSSAAVYIDTGSAYEGNLNYDFYKPEKSAYSIAFGTTQSLYNQYTSYNYETYTTALKYRTAGDSVNFSIGLSYLSTYYAGIFSQDFLKFSTDWEWQTSAPELGLELTYTNYMANYPSQYYADLVFWARWEIGEGSLRLALSPIYGSGPQAVFTPPGQTWSLLSGNTADRYAAGQASLEWDNDWSEKWSSSLGVSFKQTNYSAESFAPNFSYPPGVTSGARSDELVNYSASLKWQVQPKTWNAKVDATSTQSQSQGFQGVSSASSGNPSANYNRLLLAVNVQREF